jgi:hypothetical protein
VDPAALSTTAAARLLSHVSGLALTAADIEADVADGAPTNADGTINLVHYAAWLVSVETPRGAHANGRR